jgi:hypothetical protein
VAVFIDKMEFDKAVAVDVNIDAFDVDGDAKPGISAREKGGTASLQTYVSTGVDKAKRGRRGGDMSAESRGKVITRFHVGRHVTRRVGYVLFPR